MVLNGSRVTVAGDGELWNALSLTSGNFDITSSGRQCLAVIYLPPSPPPSSDLTVVKQYQSYSDPEEPAISTSSEEEGVVLPLGETTLTCNLGLPVIVVCCKVREKLFDFHSENVFC